MTGNPATRRVSELIVARTVQGLGAAAVLPLSLTILTTAFPPEKRGMIVGVYGGLAGLAVVFSGNGHLGTAAGITAGFRPALWACAAFAVLAALTAFGICPRRTPAVAPVETAELPVAA